MDKKIVSNSQDIGERTALYPHQEIHNFMRALAPQANPNTAYYTRTFECLCSLMENGPLNDNYYSFIRGLTQKLNVKPEQLKQSLDMYIQSAWYAGDKPLMLKVMNYNIDTKTAHPEVKEFLDACYDYLNPPQHHFTVYRINE